MIRSLTLMALFCLTVGSGCLRDRKTDDPLRPPLARASEPASRNRPAAAAASRTSPDDIRVAPGNLESPAKVDDRKKLPDRVADRKDRREERRDPQKAQLPSPYAPKPEAVAEAPKVATGDLATARKLYDIAAREYDKLTDFEATLTRKEVVGRTEMPTEVVLFQYRKKPFSIYMRNLGEVGKGREVLYVDGANDGKMHVVIGEGDGNILMKTGSHMQFSPTNPLVTSKSRHKITEAGFGDSLAKFGKLIKLAENGTCTNSVKALGKVNRKEVDHPLDGLELTLQPGDEPSLPKGGKKIVYFDLTEGSPAYGFPVLLITHDENGREVENYFFDKIKCPAGLRDSDFNADRLHTRNRR